ncbi:MAG: DoxX family protein [Candidatus Dormibacteraeota bacterium]|nr:DoxX family protein [Candidatus Dormibacteraeota bacterium]MBV9525680.1 DoxX family protein [Candidatus Dormibacteraeota bacterium]
MSPLLWVVQTVLAAMFFTAAAVRATRYDFAKRQMAWVGAVPRPLLLVISGVEMLGALGLVVPGVTRVAVVLTPAAALCLVAVQLLALGFHVRRHEPRNAGGNVALTAALVFIAVGRLALASL